MIYLCIFLLSQKNVRLFPHIFVINGIFNKIANDSLYLNTHSTVATQFFILSIELLHHLRYDYILDYFFTINGIFLETNTALFYTENIILYLGQTRDT